MIAIFHEFGFRLPSAVKAEYNRSVLREYSRSLKFFSLSSPIGGIGKSPILRTFEMFITLTNQALAVLRGFGYSSDSFYRS